MKSGLLLFCQHAYPASLNGACGQTDSEALKTFIQTGQPPENIKEVLRSFPNVIKNLKRLSEISGIKDIFDYRLIEAYWLGNNLLEKFPKDRKPFHLASLLQTLKPALKNNSRRAVTILENCRISYGQILTLKNPLGQKTGRAKVIEYNPISNRPKAIAFRKDRIKTVKFIDPRLKKNDLISMHHNYICAALTEKQLVQLAGHTLLQLCL